MHRLLILAVLLFVSLISYGVFVAYQQVQHKNVPAQMAAKHQVGYMSEKLQRDSPVNVSKAAEKPLQVVIKHKENEMESWIEEVEIEFTNTSDAPVQIVKRLDGSFYGWYQPHYKFSATNSQGSELELLSRCGNSGLWSQTTFPESYLVTLEPGESHSETGHLPFAVSKTGQFNITFEYIYNYEAYKASSPKNTGDFPWTQAVEGVWQGNVRSDSITLELKKNDQDE